MKFKISQDGNISLNRIKSFNLSPEVGLKIGYKVYKKISVTGDFKWAFDANSQFDNNDSRVTSFKNKNIYVALGLRYNILY